jgi:hypothetical protein
MDDVIAQIGVALAAERTAHDAALTNAHADLAVANEQVTTLQGQVATLQDQVVAINASNANRSRAITGLRNGRHQRVFHSRILEKVVQLHLETAHAMTHAMLGHRNTIVTRPARMAIITSIMKGFKATCRKPAYMIPVRDRYVREACGAYILGPNHRAMIIDEWDT